MTTGKKLGGGVSFDNMWTTLFLLEGLTLNFKVLGNKFFMRDGLYFGLLTAALLN